MENKDTAYLSNKGGFTIFSYGGYDFPFLSIYFQNPTI